MNTLDQKLRHVIAEHIQVASAADIIAITSSLCAPAPVTCELEFEEVKSGSPRFEVGSGLGNGGIVTDAQTGLMWTHENVSGGRMKWADAKKAAAGIRLGGYTDWRLPTIRELLSIVDYDKSEPAIDTNAFKCESAWYWTSTPSAPSPGDYAWLVNFNDGDSYWLNQYDEGFVRAVRASQLVGSLA